MENELRQPFVPHEGNRILPRMFAVQPVAAVAAVAATIAAASVELDRRQAVQAHTRRHRVCGPRRRDRRRSVLRGERRVMQESGLLVRRILVRRRDHSVRGA